MKYFIISFCILAVFLCGCGYTLRAPVVPPLAAGFMNVEAPIDVTFNNTVIGPKRGEANSTGVIGLLSFGDASAQAAARNGNIKRVDHIGYSFTNILGFVTIWKTVVYGE